MLSNLHNPGKAVLNVMANQNLSPVAIGPEESTRTLNSLNFMQQLVGQNWHGLTTT